MPGKNIVFDLDGTLIGVDSAQAWLNFLQNEKYIGASKALQDCTQIMQHYDSGSLDMAAYMKSWLKPITGMQVPEVHQLVKRFAEEIIRPTIFTQGLMILNSHLEKCHRVVIASASPSLIVKPIAALFGVTETIGINVEIIENKISLVATEPFTFQEGKALAVNYWLQKNSHKQIDIAYSDSINDVALLSSANAAYCINPDTALRDLAAKNQWPVLQWK